MSLYPNLTSIQLDYGEGIPGRTINENPATFTVLNHVAGGTVNLAAFCWLGSDDRVNSTGTGVPFGFVLSNWAYYIDDRTGWSQVAKENDELTILRDGDVWAQSSTAATVGQKVFANLTTGLVSTGAAGATVSGAIETSFIVRYVSPESNNLIAITNLDPVDTAAINSRLTALESA